MPPLGINAGVTAGTVSLPFSLAAGVHPAHSHHCHYVSLLVCQTLTARQSQYCHFVSLPVSRQTNILHVLMNGLHVLPNSDAVDIKCTRGLLLLALIIPQ